MFQKSFYRNIYVLSIFDLDLSLLSRRFVDFITENTGANAHL